MILLLINSFLLNIICIVYIIMLKQRIQTMKTGFKGNLQKYKEKLLVKFYDLVLEFSIKEGEPIGSAVGRWTALTKKII